MINISKYFCHFFSANVQNNPFLIHIADQMYNIPLLSIHILSAALANATAINAAPTALRVHAKQKSLKSQINGL